MINAGPGPRKSFIFRVLASAMVGMAIPGTKPASALLALADQCVQCGLCLPHCPTYSLDAAETESPRGRIAYIKAVLGGQLAATDAGDLHLDHCLGCRRCESACPAGVRYGALLVGGREAQRLRAGAGRRGRLALWLLRSPYALSLLLGSYRHLHAWLPRGLRPLPRPPRALPWPETGAQTDAALFVGCIASAYESPARTALHVLLRSVGVVACEPAGQGCCGAAAVHAGDRLQANSLARKNSDAFSGYPTVLSLATGCHETLADSLGAGTEVVDALAFLEARASRLRFRPANGRRIALHVPCTQANVVRSDGALRRLLAMVPGLDVVELTDSGCCGSAGLHMQQFPERAAALRAPILQALAESGAEQLLSANIGCRLHLQNGTRVPVRHPVEFLAEQLA